jgi:hypothetical protein
MVEPAAGAKLYLGIFPSNPEEAKHVADFTRIGIPDLAGYRDESVEAIISALQFHRLTREQRYAFMDEVWRVLAPTKQIKIIIPYYSSHLAVTDPLAQWPPLAEGSFLHYSRDWRNVEAMTELLPLKCNFTFTVGHVNDGDVAPRHEDYRTYAAKHYFNAVHQLHVTLTRQP